jgi:hypothetical protein
MQQIKSILLLFIIGIILFPWQVICPAHPFGHEHHHHNGPSPCELHRIASQQKGQHILPPMECGHISPLIDGFQPTQVENVVPTFHTFVVFAILIGFINCNIEKQPFFFSPDPHCRSATLISDNPLRGPPLV